MVNKADPNAQPIIQLVLSGPQGQDALYQNAVNDIQPPWRAWTVWLRSTSEAAVRARSTINLDPAKMAAYGLSLQAVQNALDGQQPDRAGGLASTKGKLNIPVRAVGQFANLDDVRNLVVLNPNTGAAAPRPRLSCLARIRAAWFTCATSPRSQDSYADRTSVLRYNGADTVSIGVVKTSDANTIQVSTRRTGQAGRS